MPITQLHITLVFFHCKRTVASPEHYPHEFNLRFEPQSLLLSHVLLPDLRDT